MEGLVRGGSGHSERLLNFLLDLDRPRTDLVPRQVCQNIDIRLTRQKNSKNKAASRFQEDFMANLWSSIQLIEHIPLCVAEEWTY